MTPSRLPHILFALYPFFWAAGLYYLYFVIFVLSTTTTFLSRIIKHRQPFFIAGLILTAAQLLSTFLASLNSDISGDRYLAIVRNYLIFFSIFLSAAYFSREKISASLPTYLSKLILCYAAAASVLYAFYLFTGVSEISINYPHQSITFIATDFIAESKFPRLSMLGDYANSAAIFITCCFFTLCTLDHNGNASKARVFLFAIMLLLVVFTGSRITLFVLLCFTPVVLSRNPKITIIFITIGAVTALFFLLSGLAEVILNARAGSSSMRERIYLTSINMVMNESPIFGMGYKPYIPGWDYPLGSHSTPIGYLFKNGIYGLSIYLLCHLYFIIKFLHASILSISNNSPRADLRRKFISFYAINLMLVVFFFEDIDGTELNAISLGMLLSTSILIPKTNSSSSYS